MEFNWNFEKTKLKKIFRKFIKFVRKPAEN